MRRARRSSVSLVSGAFWLLDVPSLRQTPESTLLTCGLAVGAAGSLRGCMKPMAAARRRIFEALNLELAREAT